MPRRIESVVALLAPGVFVVLWASGFVGARLGLPYVEPLTFLTLRMAGVIVLMALVIAVTRPAWPSARAVGHSVVSGLLMHGGYLGGVFVAIDHKLAVGLTALIVGLQPILVSTLANRVLGERVTPRHWAGLALGIVGVYLIVQDKTVGGEADTIAWIAIVTALLSITSGTLWQKRHGGEIDWRPAFLVQYGAAGAVFAAGAALFETGRIEWTGELVFALAWLVLVLSLGAIWLLYFLIRRAAASRISSLFYLTPPATAVMAWALFDERLGPVALAGMAICVAGVFLVNVRLRTT
ncbi:DMT family transporter [Rhodoplanes sp. TEM]|uniref:DMT family transporter n=1 Tax=Rhodoplanes tepidamans TaxID=200616 RepID=A0ABT5JER5_RHOTP|nr:MULTISPECIES: DMT family transporter [Rhodoplanes]MDC7788099.1 DMT family transporter [Rhodoplanes tepidamans]MDC7987552.1 DMT family transporter [Rhodoplanes sp. TEM]MDQ0355611.1 drug/metabolite transporter (DMT)-like permease [Rhodoplanes tepidamans]